MSKLEPVDETFFETAPKRDVGTFEIPRPAAEVWLQLTRDGALDYCRALKGAQWTSPRPFGVGTTRIMGLTGGGAVHETFFRWEEGRRKSFYAREMGLPLFRRFAEDYLLEPTGPDSCRFVWTIAAEPSQAGRVGAPVSALVNRSLFADTRKHFGAT